MSLSPRILKWVRGNDGYYFFDCIDDNLANSTYRIFEPHCKIEIFNWFSREDVAKEQKEDFIQALVDFQTIAVTFIDTALTY